MKKIILGFIACLLFIGTQAFSQELKWYSWSEGYTKAKDEGKIVLMDAYTDWCGWCKVMDKKTFSEAEVMKLIEKDYIPVKLNPELEGSYEYEGTSYTGKELINKLSDGKFGGYPTCFFIFTKTKTVSMEVGYKEAAAFKEILIKNTEAASSTETKGSSKGKSKGKN